MAENITELPDIIHQGTTPKLTFDIEDEDGNAIPAGNLTTLILNLFNLDDSDNTVLNNRTDQDVLNANNVTVSSGGAGVWSMQVADTAMVGTDNIERHRAVFKWTYDSGNKTGDHIIDMRIRNIIKTTS